jgi:hypothetical protein
MSYLPLVPTSNFWRQVSQSKFTGLKTMPSLEIFGLKEDLFEVGSFEVNWEA